MDRTKKYNYIEVVNKMVPEVYRDTDFKLFGSEEDVSVTFLGKILKAAMENDKFFSGVTDKSGGTYSRNEMAPFFVPKNKKTRITPNSFSRNILSLYGYSFESFRTTQELYNFFSGTFLPDSTLNNPSGLHAIMSGTAFGEYSSLSSVHNYLIDNLGMFYFMNTSSLSSTSVSAYASSLITDAILDPLTKGEPATEKDAINSLFSYFWHNRDDNSYCKSFIPTEYASGTSEISGGTYTSGVQLLSSVHIHLNTWTDDRLQDHTFLSDSLEVLIGGGQYPKQMRDAGPFQRFLKAVSLGIADTNLILEEISDLLSIDECPERFLELLANNIGWIFLTGEYSKWRAQLRNAVLMYKSKGSVLGMTAAFKLIFPDGLFSMSDITECWESYVPKLLYYLLKTESFIAKNESWFDRIDTLFPGSKPDVKFNQAPRSYVNGEDRNCRFFVDAILEDMHNQFHNIQIQDRDFRILDMWRCLPDGVPGGRGFKHRNYPQDNDSPPFHVSVPPWEKYGFYKETKFGTDEIEYLCKTLSGAREDFGFEVGEGYVAAFKTMLTTAYESIYAVTGTPTYGENNKFLFFTSGHALPPNYTKYVEFGHTSSLRDFDTWNTKSSHIFSVMSLSSIDNTLVKYDTFRNKGALQVYVDVLREFLPLHVTARIILHHELEDTHCTNGTLCVLSNQCLDTHNLGTLNSFRTSFFVGASGTGSFSSTVNEDGRVLPPTSGIFWDATATNLDRTASRRRNYKYSLPCYPYTRTGKGMPIAVTHFPYATSASIADLSSDPYLNTWEYVIKGFDYNLQDFYDISSSVWDTSSYFSGAGACMTSGTTFSSFDLSNTYPIRAVPDDPTSCDQVPLRRDNLDGVMRVMTRRILKNSFSDKKFSDLDYRTFVFGDSVHRNYHIYRGEFSGALDDRTVPGYYNYGGHNFISYAYGPTIWNNDLRFKGNILANTSAVTSLGSGDPPEFGSYVPEWSSVIGGTDADGASYFNLSGATVTLSSKTYFGDSPVAQYLSSMEGVVSDTDFFGDPILRTREILSGLELRQVGSISNCFAVVNTKDASIHNATRDYSITFYNQGVGNIQLVIPFDPSDIGQAYYNKLRPQSKFKIITAVSTQKDKDPQSLEVELTTSGLLDDAGNSFVWAYSWLDDKWKPYTRDLQFKKRFLVTDDCPRELITEFNTLESRTEKSVPCGPIFKTGDVHTSSTAYTLKVSNVLNTRSENSVISNGLTVYGISIVDKTLNLDTNSFNSNDTCEIYQFWDTLSEGDFSRTPANITNTIFGANGGSRAEYVELVGGATSTSQGFIVQDGRQDYNEYIISD